MKKLIAITDNSVWLVTEGTPLIEGGQPTLYIEDRATFGSPYIEDGRRFSGAVIAGSLKPGSRLTFQNDFADSEGRLGRPVHTGAINRVVAFADEPAPSKEPRVENGITFIELTPDWTWLMPFVQASVGVRVEARRAFDLVADLVALVAMGRVTQEDLQAARRRRASTS